MAIVAGVDFGTLSVRVTIVDTERGRLGSGAVEYPLHRKKDDPDHATQSHDDHMRALTEATRKATAAAHISGDEVDALAIDTKMKPEDLVITNLQGEIVEGVLRPSSDLATHLILYRAFASIGGIAHTHSRAATSWAQAQREIPCFGTTHADYFHGPVPATKPLTPAQIRGDYEANTGHAIVRRFAKLDPLHFPAVLVAGHAPFCWGPTPAEAAHIAVIVEEIAVMASQTLAANPKARNISKHLHDKHFRRKHGRDAYYGQNK